MCPHDFAGAMVNHLSHEFASLLIGGQGYADKDKTVETESFDVPIQMVV